MNVLLMSTVGIQQVTFVLPVAEHLRKQGHQVVLACSDEPGEAGQSFIEPLQRLGFEVLVIRMRRHISLLSDALAIVRLYIYLRTHRFDVVHVQTAKAGMIGRIAAWFARVPVVVYTAHAFPFHEYLSPWRIHFYALLERMASRLCHVIVVDSECVKARGLEYRVSAPDHIRVIPMGIDTDRFDPRKYEGRRGMIRLELGLDPSVPVVGAVARLVPDKGLDCLLRAVSLLVQRYPDLQCVLIGNGPILEELRGLSRTLGLENHVFFAGHRTDVPQVLAAMDIFMLPTLREGFGVVFVEAMSMEVPVVASRISPITEIVVDERTGLLAEAGNAEAFAEAADSLLGDPERRRLMGGGGRRHVIERFNQHAMCQVHERLFGEYHERSRKPTDSLTAETR